MIWWPAEVPTLSYGLTTLRALTPADIPDIYRELQDPVIPQFTTIPANYTMENAEFFVNKKTTEYLAEKRSSLLQLSTMTYFQVSYHCTTFTWQTTAPRLAIG